MKDTREQWKEIISNYHQDYEWSNDNSWVKEQADLFEAVESEDISDELYTNCRELAYSSQNLGFIQGMHFALEFMGIISEDKNKELLQKALTILEQDT